MAVQFIVLVIQPSTLTRGPHRSDLCNALCTRIAGSSPRPHLTTARAGRGPVAGLAALAALAGLAGLAGPMFTLPFVLTSG